MTRDERYMRRALALAVKTVGLASPNPQVGCVLELEGAVLCEGAHVYEQRDHAEVVALQQAAMRGRSAAGATAYVTLEPCSHHGRTPPCADALIRARIGRCVVATQDPNPLVGGEGIARLRAAGVRVEVGLLESEARRLNDAFACSITRRRPLVTLKAALSRDGMLAPAPALRSGTEPHWLTGPESRAEVHRMRHGSDAILTGIGTVLDDDPLLTDRSGLARRRPLLRVVLDSRLGIPLDCQLVRTALRDGLLVLHGAGVLPEKVRALTRLGVRVQQLDLAAGGLNLSQALAVLHAQGCLSVLLEAGSRLNAALLRARLVDRAVLFYAPVELGPAAVPFAAGGASPFALEQSFVSVSRRNFGQDVCVSGLLQDPWRV